MKTSTAVVCIFVLLLPCVASQGLSWSQVQTGGQPSPRSATAFGYDPLGNQLIVFSGFGGSNDTWIFDIDSGNWSEVQLTQPAPPSRGLAYYGVVRVSGESLFVVALGILSGEFNDVWVFRFSTMEWAQLEPEGNGPSFRYGGHFGTAYGDSNTFWLGSGFTETTPLQTRYIDTYKLVFSSPTAATWEQVYGQPSPGNQFMPLSPHGRCLQASTVIAGAGVVMSGGCMRGGKGGGPCPTDDTWFFNDNRSSWEELNRCITPRTWGGMAPLTNSPGKALLYGGNDDFSKQLLAVAESPYPESEVFVVDAFEGEWRRYSVESADYPDRRFQHGMAAGPDGVIYVFGGSRLSNGSRLNDLWVLSGNLSQTTEIGCNNVWFSFAHLHGLLMFLAFGLLFPWGVIVAQLFRCKKSKAWFIVHIIIQLTAALIAIAAFIIIFSVAERAGQVPTHPHAIIGIFLMFFMLIQPINGIFRPHIKKDEPKSTYRVCWEWFHRVYGSFVIILGFVQVTLGVFLIVSPLGVWVTWIIILICWCIGFLVVNIFRVIGYFCRREEDGIETHEMK